MSNQEIDESLYDDEFVEKPKPDGISADQLLNDVKKPDPKVRCDAITALSQVKNKRVVNILINCLKDPVWNNRSAAANSLIEIGELSIEPLLAVVNSDNEDIRFWSIRILGTLGKGGVAALANLLNNPDRDLRVHVIKSLSLSNDPLTIDPLIVALGDSDWSIRKNAAEGLFKMGQIAVPKLQKAFQGNLNSMGNDDICYWSIKVLGRIMQKSAVPVFMNLIKHQDKNIRFYAVGGLGETRTEDAVDPLIQALSDPSWLVRRHAFEMLEIIGEPAVEKLKNAFFQGNDDIKYWAVRLIARILKGNSVEILKKMLNTTQKEIRFFIVTALGETDDPRAILTLIECFKDNFWQIRQQAAEMVAKMKFRAIPAISGAISNESEDVRFWAVQVLGMIGGEAMDALLKLRTHPDKRMRLFAVKALGNLQSSSIIEPLIESLGDSSWPVRTSAAENLERVGEYAIRPLIKAIGSEVSDISFWAQKILQNFGDKAVQTLINSLSDKNDKYRQHTIKALGKIGTKNSIKPLLEILSAGIIEECEAITEALADLKNVALISYLLETVATSDDQNIITWVSQILAAVKEAGKSVYFKALKHEETPVRLWACKLLGGYEGDDIMKALWFAMQDKESSVRTQAVKSVGEIGQGLNIIPYVIKLMSDPDTMVRLEVYRLLAKLGSPNSIIPMLEAFQLENEPNQKLIFEVFKDIETTNFMMAMIQTLDTAGEHLHELILSLLEKVSDSPLRRDTLIKNLENANASTVFWTIQVLIKFDDEAIAEALIKLLDRDDSYEHVVAAMTKYMTATGSRNFVVRDKVFSALTKCGPKVIKPLLNKVTKTDEFMKQNAFSIIENMGDQIKPTLEEICGDKSNHGFTLAVELLNEITRTAQIGGGAKKWAAPKLKDTGGKNSAAKINEEIEREMAKTKLK